MPESVSIIRPVVCGSGTRFVDMGTSSGTAHARMKSLT
jgi:hypothetical protein